MTTMYASGRKDSVVENINDANAAQPTATATPDANAQPDIVSSATTDMPSDSPSDAEAIEVWPSSLEVNEEGKQPIAYRRELPSGEPSKFHEVWGYVLEGRESDFSTDLPVTDLCIFSADVNIYGEISQVPNPNKVKDYKGRKHLVITCDSKSLTHFVLDPQYAVRDSVIKQIVHAAKDYDGVQIDFELVPARDVKNFRSFLRTLRSRLGEEKWFSVALPARMKTLSNDVYDYALISDCVDRIIVMAYDEHWSTSKPGPVASLDWCEKVADYAATVIPAKKLVMGMPFYGRTWEKDMQAGAFRFSGINEVMNSNSIHTVTRDEGMVPCFTYKKFVTVTGYFDDTVSLVSKSRLYESKNITRVAFWRIGQEDSAFWKWIVLN
jgi:hypothetical protein